MAVVQPIWSNVKINSGGLDWMEEMEISTGELRLAAIKLPRCESSLHFAVLHIFSILKTVASCFKKKFQEKRDRKPTKKTTSSSKLTFLCTEAMYLYFVSTESLIVKSRKAHMFFPNKCSCTVILLQPGGTMQLVSQQTTVTLLRSLLENSQYMYHHEILLAVQELPNQ